MLKIITSRGLLRFLLGAVCSLVMPVATYAQYENVWVFGRNAGIDFNGAVPVPITTNIGSTDIFGESSASICDENGQLLFYTEGTRVLDRQHNLMPNGNNLTPLQSTIIYGTPTTSTSQGSIIIPRPGRSGQYYVFSLTSREMGNDGGKAFYSIVDIALNGGLGDVVAGEKGIPVDSNLTEQMTAVVGCNNNVWLLVGSKTKELKAFEITTAGIAPPVTSACQNMCDNLGGGIAVSRDRRKVAISGLCLDAAGLLLFDFDPGTGALSNEQALFSLPWGSVACFSPDDTKLYFNSSNEGIIQYDLTAGSLIDIIASRTTVSPPSAPAHLKLAPDNKIYFQQDSATALSVIHKPNEPGLACQPQAHVITLTGIVHIGLPNIVPVLMKSDTTVYSTRKVTSCISSFALSPVDTTGWGYVWNDGTTGKRRIVSNSGTYWVSYTTDSCVFHTDTIEYSVTITSSYVTGSFCANESFFFNGRVLDNAGIYYDTLTTSGGCDSIVILDLAALPAPRTTVEEIICTGETYLFNGRMLNSTGVYYDTLTTSGGCDSFITLELTVLPLQDSVQKEIICAGGSWLFNGRTLTSTGIYSDTLPDVNGCDSVITLELTVAPLPEVNITVAQEKSSFCLGDTISCLAVPDEAARYQWYSNGRFAGGNNPVDIHLSGHTTDVLVIGYSEHDCRDSAAMIIHAERCCDLFIPNAFTPDGDGLSDGFGVIPEGDDFSNFRMQIFNRWGQMVFASHNINARWDGSYHGRPVDVGVYSYVITALCPGERVVSRKGNVTLIR